jgi:hypothetical protein
LSNYFDKYHIFRDPIHGYIKVYDIERDIINTSAFQRLRRIKQLGPTNLIYHGADHTRFAHSLGVMELASRVYDILVLKDKQDKLLGWNEVEIERNKIFLRLVALLHDIGHPPLSHVGEGILFGEEGGKKLTHKDFSKKVILGDKAIKENVDELNNKYQINSEKIGKFITKEESDPILQPIIDGPLDVDRMDYLWRDSFYTGVYYGRFDLDRLVNTLTMVRDKFYESPTLGIDEGGVYTAEALILARYYMFLQVYFHPVRRAYDLHFTEFIKKTLLKNLGEKYPFEIKEYLEYDDSSVSNKIKEEITNNGENKNLANILMYRQHHECVKETLDYTSPKEKEIFEKNVKEIKEKFGGNFLTDNAQDAPNKFKKERFYVKLKAPRSSDIKDKYKEIERVSNIIKSLDEGINKNRLYAPKNENLEEVKKLIVTKEWEP